MVYFFGLLGSNNDVNELDQSPLINNMLTGEPFTRLLILMAKSITSTIY